MGQGDFTYNPDTDWEYIDGDELVFRTASGPFALQFESLEEGPSLTSPLRGAPEMIVSNPSVKGPWEAGGKVETVLTPEEIRERFLTLGRVGTYKYNLTVNVNNGESTFSDNSHNGTYRC